MTFLPKRYPDQPETAGVHGVLAGVLYSRLDVLPNKPRSPHDPCFTFKVNGDSFTIHITPERTRDTYTLLHSHGSFPWNGKWRLQLTVCDGSSVTYRPKSDQVKIAAEKIMDRVVAFVEWRKATSGPVKLRLVVDNTKKEI